MFGFVVNLAIVSSNDSISMSDSDMLNALVR
jgi:hypothetical protein